ncbi:hypothetical protein G9A89_015273 [Geosiphon pyriformis]|nr:hypothetical protein G9A89_015273 [Geosiphon pyriformis]
MSFHLTSDSDLRQFENQVSRVFDNFFNTSKRGNRSSSSQCWVPSIDLHEIGENYVVNAELPGIPKENINVDIRENVLHISGESKADQKYKEGKTHIQERCYGNYARAIPLPSNIKSEEITAKFEDGILEVNIPKAENAVKKISVQ